MDSEQIKPVAEATPEVNEAPGTPVAQPVAGAAPVQQVQYVKMEQSVEGIGGWLLFFMICFGLAGMGFIMNFFMSIASSSFGGPQIVALIFSPILAGGFITSVVMLAMQKKIGILITYATLGVALLNSIIGSIVSYSAAKSVTNSIDLYIGTSTSDYVLPTLIGTILVSIVSYGLIGLFFHLSKRVKATITK